MGIGAKTKGELESAVAEGVAVFQQQYMGHGPQRVTAHLIGDVILVRLHKVLTTAEQHLVSTPPDGTGRDLVKQMRRRLVEAVRPLLAPVIEAATTQKVVSLHHDLSTLTGEEVIIFALDGEPALREGKKKCGAGAAPHPVDDTL